MTPLSTDRESWPGERQLEARRTSASRDAGLRRVSRLTGLAVVVAVGLTGIVTEVVAHALPAQSKQAAAVTPRPAPGSAARAVDSNQPSAAYDQQPSNPQPPAQAPAPSSASGGAVSGGS